jgi:hypothetical protein
LDAEKVGACTPRFIVKLRVSVYPQGDKVIVAINVPPEIASGVKDTSLPFAEMLVCVQFAGACQVML